MDVTKSDALKFKEEGNALFVQKKWTEAAAKYSLAIEQDATDPTFHCNRSACMLQLKKGASYREAQTDASRATELNPNYAKAWSRLAVAMQELHNMQEAKEAWKQAVAAFPPDEELLPADKVQKQQYEKSLAAVHAAIIRKQNETLSTPIVPNNLIPADLRGNLPWERAAGLESLLMTQRNITSSAWCILGAYLEFKEGVDKLSEHTEYNINEGGEQGMYVVGKSGVLQGLSNGCLRDRRVMWLLPPNFMSAYNKQVAIECQSRRAWIEENPRTILQSAQDRLRTETWDDVRISLAVTVRRFIMNGFLSNTLKADIVATVSLFDTALGVLEGGRKIWENVPDSARGSIFTKSFIRGLKSLRLDAFMMAHMKNPRKYSLNALRQAALELAADVSDNPYPDQDRHHIHPGHELSFWTYPLAEANVMLAFCEKQLANKCKDPEQAAQMYIRAAEFYAKAAELYPEDEENRCTFYEAALECYWSANAPLSVTLPIAVKLKETVPKMMKIWEHSAYAKKGDRDKKIKLGLDFEREAQSGILEGRWALTEPIKPLFD